MILPSNLLIGKVAIVTGCNRGIGKSILELFLSNGAIVYGVSREENLLNKISSDNFIPCYFDVQETESIKKLISKIKKEQGHLDILVNNAGVMKDSLIGMISDSQIQETFSVNVFSMINFIQYSARLMSKQKSGSIINISSIMGIGGNSHQLVYSASKGAVISLTKSAAKELAKNNIRVNSIAPGVIDTNLISDISEEKMNSIVLQIAMSKIGNPSDVANAALFLASDMSNYISGQILGVDGMMSI